MKCKKCNYDNLRKANYCQYCGNEFLNSEKEAVKDPKVLKNMKFWEKCFKIVTLDYFKEKYAWFRFLILIILAIPALLHVFDYGFDFKLESDDNYKIEYKENDDSYYVTLKEKPNETNVKTKLKLYIPNYMSSIYVRHFDEEGKMLSEEVIGRDSELEVEVNLNDDNYYQLSSMNGKSKIKVYVYYGDAK